MRLREIMENLYLVRFKSQYECASTMMRMEEFYESKSINMKGKYFTLEKLMDTYAKNHGNFTYLSDWGGFNIKGYSIQEFYELFHYHDDLSNKELKLLELLDKKISDWRDRDFYLIALHEDIYLKHEIAHGMWHLNKEYQNEMRKNIRNMDSSIKDQVISTLKEWGYGRSCMYDEIHAYMCTGSLKEIREEFKLKKPLVTAKPFRQTFKYYYKKMKQEYGN